MQASTPMTLDAWQVAVARTQGIFCSQEHLAHTFKRLREELDELEQAWEAGEGKAALELEAGDTFNFLTALCTFLGFDLQSVALENIGKMQRRMPGGYGVDTFDVSINAKAVAR